MIRQSARLLLAGAFVLGGTVFLSTGASAQATRTWISGVGDDANPCSRTAPCKTFAGSISKTAAGGEINCIDPGGFGAVTITKSITLNCESTESGITAPGTNAITINAATTDYVILRGLDLEGVATGLNGIRVLQAGSVEVYDTLIRGFRNTNGTGILFTPSNAGARLLVENTVIDNNSVTGSGGGVVIQPTGSGTANVVLRNDTVTGNTNGGVRADTTGNTGTGYTIAVLGGTYSGNGAGISVSTPPSSSTPVNVLVSGAAVSNNTGIGILSNGMNSTISVGNSQIFGNGAYGVYAVNAAAGKGVLSFTPASNQVTGNLAGGGFSGTVAAQ